MAIRAGEDPQTTGRGDPQSTEVTHFRPPDCSESHGIIQQHVVSWECGGIGLNEPQIRLAGALNKENAVFSLRSRSWHVGGRYILSSHAPSAALSDSHIQPNPPAFLSSLPRSLTAQDGRYPEYLGRIPNSNNVASELASRGCGLCPRQPQEPTLHVVCTFLPLSLLSPPFNQSVMVRSSAKSSQLRFLRTFLRRLTDPSRTQHLSPRCLFLPAISRTRSPALECDYNLHKSNSTYFTDMDMSRGNFCLLLFGAPFNPVPGPEHFTMVLGGTSCTWHREIKPYQSYELWTRVVSWDDKWLYVVTHFIEAGVFRPEEYVMQPWRGAKKVKGKQGPPEMGKEKAVFASSVARYVFKNNRKTIPPEKALSRAGLLPKDDAALAEVERLRVKGLPVGRLEGGWEMVRNSFKPGPAALGWYSGVY